MGRIPPEGEVGLSLDPSPTANFAGVRREELKIFKTKRIPLVFFYLANLFPEFEARERSEGG